MYTYPSTLIDAKVVKALSAILNAVSPQSFFFREELPEVKSSTGVAFGAGSLLTDGPLAHRLLIATELAVEIGCKGEVRLSSACAGSRAETTRMERARVTRARYWVVVYRAGPG
jgi:hypothetical protein